MKGKKLVIAVILALIVCLVLIPTCAFAEEIEGSTPSTPDANAQNNDNLVVEVEVNPVEKTDTTGGDNSTTGNVDGENKDVDVDGSTDASTGTPEIEVSYPKTGEDGEVTTTTVNTIQDALNDEDNKNVSITLYTDVTESITIAEGKTVTIDLNGKTLSNDENKHTILNNGTLYIVDNSTEKTGRVDNTSHGYAALVNSGVAYLNGGTFDRSQEQGTFNPDSGNGNSWYTIVNDGTMTINDGVTVKQDGSYSSLIVNRDNKQATLTINGGTFSGGKNAIKNGENDTLVIKGGVFKAGAGSVILNWCNATISGGTFTATGNCPVIRNGTWGNSKGVLTITGGTFNAHEDSCIVSTKGDSQGANSVSVTGGTFNGTMARDIKENTTLAITGGVYTDSSILGLAPNTLIVEYEDVYGVENEAIVVAQAAAYNGEAINVVAAAENTTVTDVPEGVTIVNNSDNTIIINGVAVKPDTSYTVPVTPAAAPLSAKYFVISGNNQQWTAGDLEIKLNSKDVVKVLIDGVEVEFTVAEDGTLTIASAVIEKLESGTHEIEFVYADGSCKTVFTVA